MHRAADTCLFVPQSSAIKKFTENKIDCEFLHLFLRTELNEEWAFATKLKDFGETEDERCDNEIDIFEVKFLGSTLIDEPRSETVTANAVKHMVSKTKCKHFTLTFL